MEGSYKNMRKKIIAFLVCGILAISLAGCSQIKNIDAPALAQALLENGVYSENLTEVSSKITAPAGIPQGLLRFAYIPFLSLFIFSMSVKL